MPIGLSLIMLGVFPHCLTVYIRSASGRERHCDGLMLSPSFFVCLSKQNVTDNVRRVERVFFFTVRSFRAAPPAPVLGARKRLQPFIPKIGPRLSPSGFVSSPRSLRFKKDPCQSENNTERECVDHFELVHREALYFSKAKLVQSPLRL